jgi:protein subunit release factor B
MFSFRPPVSPEKQKQLKKRMDLLGIREEDLEEKFVRSSGPGGQNVNKTSTCVHLRHIPTGILVKCQDSRSQPLNRFLARRYLVEKLEAIKMGKESPEAKKLAKIRKQKAKARARARKKYSLKSQP